MSDVERVTWFGGERPVEGATVYVKPPAPDVLKLVADVVKAWRDCRQFTDTEPEMESALDALERVWPR